MTEFIITKGKLKPVFATIEPFGIAHESKIMSHSLWPIDGPLDLNLKRNRPVVEEPTYQEIGSTRSGPPGANLFIYHLPKSFSDLDLYNLFVQCGKLVSVKIFKDKITEESKCFGFVSYEKENNAKIAIQKLNGFQVLWILKRLLLRTSGRVGRSKFDECARP